MKQQTHASSTTTTAVPPQLLYHHYCCLCPKGCLACLQFLLDLSCLNPHMSLTFLFWCTPILHAKRQSVHVWRYIYLIMSLNLAAVKLDIYNGVCRVICIYFSFFNVNYSCSNLKNTLLLCTLHIKLSTISGYIYIAVEYKIWNRNYVPYDEDELYNMCWILCNVLHVLIVSLARRASSFSVHTYNSPLGLWREEKKTQLSFQGRFVIELCCKIKAT